jgi:hypothetical protein
MKKLILLLGVLLPGAALAAGNETPSRAPHESVLDGVRALRNNDLKAFCYATFTRDQLLAVKREWDARRAQAPDPSESTEFREMMARLTAPGAEAAMMVELEPKLQEMRPQMTMLIGMFSGLAQGAVQQNRELGPDQRQKAARVIDVISRHLLTHDVTDVEAARKAVAILCRTARALELRTLEQVYELPIDGLLARGNLALRGLKEVVALYGVNVDQWLDSVEAETLSTSGETAKVRVSYAFLGLEESTEEEMRLVEGRWVSKKTAERGSALLR